jgi:hypothetical protein
MIIKYIKMLLYDIFAMDSNFYFGSLRDISLRQKEKLGSQAPFHPQQQLAAGDWERMADKRRKQHNPCETPQWLLLHITFLFLQA